MVFSTTLSIYPNRATNKGSDTVVISANTTYYSSFTINNVKNEIYNIFFNRDFSKLINIQKGLKSINLSSITDTSYFRCEKDTRYYEVRLGKNLFDEWSISITNGKINSRLGKLRHEHYALLKEAIKRMENIFNYRINKRKYALVKLVNNN